MIEIGKYNTLKVLRDSDAGVYLDGENFGELLVPCDETLTDYYKGEEVKVFIYYDSDKNVIATMKESYASVGEFSYLKVVDVLEMGAFLDWGLPKDLFVPIGEQRETMEKGESYVVYVYRDERRNHLAASSKLDRFLDQESANFKENDKVDLLICYETELGINAIINNAYWGLLYKDEVFQDLECGQRIEGFIKKMRDDGKIDLSLHIQGYHKMDDLEKKIMERIKRTKGDFTITDKSSPEVISEVFGVSKKKYKMALGSLYKAQCIMIADDIITVK